MGGSRIRISFYDLFYFSGIGFSLDALKSMLSETFDWNHHLKHKYLKNLNEVSSLNLESYIDLDFFPILV